MYLIIKHQPFQYELEKVCRIFCPDESIKTQEYLPEPQPDFYALCQMHQQGGEMHLSTVLRYYQQQFEQTDSFALGQEPAADETEGERRLAATLFQCLVTCFGFSPSWGMLTGVRPAKLFQMKRELFGREAAKRIFHDQYFVHAKKVALCEEVGQREEKIRVLSQKRSFSLYVSIPFCPTRCSYCSFVSHSIERNTQLIDPYLDCLCQELEQLSHYANRYGLQLETVYVGGGTPSILNSQQITRLLDCIKRLFGTPHLNEFTFESGRPDTLDFEKLSAVVAGGADRISINPQTFSDDVLRQIGRHHTSQQTLQAYQFARQAGIQNINMDLIAGLQGDTVENFCESVRKTIKLSPENITVHTLSMKRASTQVSDGTAQYSARGEDAARMLDCAEELLRCAGYLPYYMYRQSKTVGNLENIGWAKADKFGLYNIYMMDETHTILSAGAGAVTKLKDVQSGRIERIFNYKYPYEYISRFELMSEKKREISRFFEEFPL